MTKYVVLASAVVLVVVLGLCADQASAGSWVSWVGSYLPGGSKPNIKVYQDTQNRLAVVEYDGGQIKHCELYGNGTSSGILSKVLKLLTELRSLTYELIKLNPSGMQPIINDCVEVLAKRPASWALSLTPNAIYPGTKWCGAGNIANDYDDLGPFEQTDSCCRQHDHCPDFISKGDTRYEITNTGAGTMSACYCDYEFQACLKNASSKPSDGVGHMFFNILAMQCFRKDKKATECAQYNRPLTNTWYSIVTPSAWYRTIRRTCKNYKYDESVPERYQVFDSPMYTPQLGLFSL